MTKIHCMGIGGSGISAVARLSKALGYEVSGCDLVESRTTNTLRKDGIPVEIGHSPAHLKKIDFLIHTPAVFYQNITHPEYTLAASKKIAMIWEEFMGKHLQKGKFVVAVSGTHGKGTTTAMLSLILERAGLDPTCEIGANLLDWNHENMRVGKSQYFVCEADEFRDKFLLYKPSLLVVTSIEWDHPDYFKDLDQTVGSFTRFTKQMGKKGILVVNSEDEGCQKFLKRLKEIGWEGKIVKFKALTKKEIKLKLPGEHLRADSASAWAAAKALGVKDVVIQASLEGFSGLERRFEYRGEIEGAKIFDDYAHHPTAVLANIKAAREAYPSKKIWAVFQAHMYSRLQEMFDLFVKVLRSADKVVVADVFSQREPGVTKPSGKELAQAIGGPKATYVGGDLINVANFISRNAGSKDVILIMGAGDVYQVSDMLLAQKR